MKKIINGKRYDTKTAERLGSYQCGQNTWGKELYRKKTGEFFLFGEGEASSSGGSGEEITPLRSDEASEWAKKYLDGEEYEKIFGEVKEDMAQIGTWIKISIKERADKLRETKGYTIKDIVLAGVETLEAK